MSTHASATECVALLHGLWRTENSMNKIEESLVEAGYRVANIGYDSTGDPVEVFTSGRRAKISVLGELAELGLPGFSWFSGPAGLQLGTGEESVPRSLGSVTFDLGVIAGNKTINPILSQALPDKDDGKVSVESTRVDGMNDHLEMPVNHVFMMRNQEVIRQVIYYLQQGEFRRSD